MVDILVAFVPYLLDMFLGVVLVFKICKERDERNTPKGRRQFS